MIRRVLTAAAIVVGVLVLVAAVWLFRLIDPGRPATSTSLAFKGFIVLPKVRQSSPLQVLDYLTIADGTLFVTSESSGSVFEAPLAGEALPTTRQVRAFAGDPATHSVVVDPVGKLAFVSRSEANRVDVFDPRTLAAVKRIAVPDDVDGMLYEPLHKLVYAAHGDPNLATLIDPSSKAEVGEVPLGGKPEFAAFDADTGLVFQNLRDRNQLAAIDLGKRAVVGRWALDHCEEPTSMALDELDRRLFIVCAKNSQFVAFDLDRHHVVAVLDVGGSPDSVAFDPDLGRIYSTGKAGVLSVIQRDGPDAYRKLEDVKLHYGAHTLAVDPLTHRVYAGYASLFVAPRVAVFQPTLRQK